MTVKTVPPRTTDRQRARSAPTRAFASTATGIRSQDCALASSQIWLGTLAMVPLRPEVGAQLRRRTSTVLERSAAMRRRLPNLNDALWSSRPNPGPGVWSPILGRNPTRAPRGGPDRHERLGPLLTVGPSVAPLGGQRRGASSGRASAPSLSATPSTQGQGPGWTHPLPLRVAVATSRRTVLGRVAGWRNTGLQERRKPRRHRGSRSTATGIRTPVSAVRGRRPSPLDDGGRTADRVAATHPP
jgi:hypothetical protein